jgi:hypothetical protein
MTAPVATPLASTPTADKFARYVIEGLLAPWPGGNLVARPLSGALAATVTRVHALTGMLAGRTAPFDRWLSVLAGAPDGRLNGEALARQAADLVLSIANGVARPPASLAATALPPPAGSNPFPMPSPAPPLGGFTPPPSWDERTVLRALVQLAAVGAREVATLPPRLAVATAIAGTAVALPGVRSTRDVGNVVHPRLQQRYRSSYAPPNLVVTDRRVFGGIPPHRMPTTGRRLSEAIATAHPQLVTLYLSSFDQQLQRSIKRTDVTDLGRLANWEIKPVLSAPIGVMQEAWYRCAYNWMAGEFARQVPALAAELAPLSPGPPWELGLLGLIDVPPVDGQPAAAIPFSTMTLPGMVLYIVVSGPTMIELALLAALMLQLIEREAQRQLQAAAQALRAMLQALLEALEVIAKVVFELLRAVVAALVIAGLAAALILALPEAAVVVLVGGVVLFIIEQIRQRPEGPDTAAAATPITLDFPGVSVRLPAQDAGFFCAAAEFVGAGAFRALHDHVRASLGDVPVT